MAVTNFTNHNPSIFDFPDPAIPVPYTELLINAMPGYRKATAAGAHPYTVLVQLLSAVWQCQACLACLHGPAQTCCMVRYRRQACAACFA